MDVFLKQLQVIENKEVKNGVMALEMVQGVFSNFESCSKVEVALE